MLRSSYCNVSYVREALEEPAIDDADERRVTDAFGESLRLGHLAFRVGEPQARVGAERVLYAIHTYNAFAPPVHNVVSVVWSNLIVAKLRSLPMNHVDASALTYDQMCTVMRAAVEEADRRDHWVLDTLDRRGLVVYAKNWYTSAHGFEEQLMSTFHRCSHPLKRMLFHNLSDELGADATPHGQLRAETLGNFDVSYDADGGGVLGAGAAFDDDDIVTEAYSASNTRTVFSLLRDPSFSLGAFYSLEACYPAVCRRIAAVLRSRGATNANLDYWTLHDEGDKEHSAEWLDGIREAKLDGETHARIANGALTHLLVRSQLFKAIGERSARER